MSELDVLVEQLEGLLRSRPSDLDDALEVAIVAGLAERLGAPEKVLKLAVTWRDGAGRDLIDDVCDEIEFDEIVARIEECVEKGADEDQVEDAFTDFDDVVAAAVWCGAVEMVVPAVQALSGMVRRVPASFAGLADLGELMVRVPGIAGEGEVYDYWSALAELDVRGDPAEDEAKD